jgi:hypothetical protein
MSRSFRAGESCRPGVKELIDALPLQNLSTELTNAARADFPGLQCIAARPRGDSRVLYTTAIARLQ